MEGRNNFGIPSTCNSVENSSNFPQIEGSSNGKSVVIESSCTKLVHNVTTPMPLPPRPISSSSLVLAPPPPPASIYPRSNYVALEKAMESELKHGQGRLDPNVDVTMLRRSISNKLSAQRSRLNKAQYILEMEKIVKDLQEQVSILTPQVRSYLEKRTALMVENDYLRQKLNRISDELKIREMEFELNYLEVNKYRELLVQGGGNEHLLDFSFGAQHTQDLCWNQFTSQSYNPYLQFYENGLSCTNVGLPAGHQLVSNSARLEQYTNSEEQPSSLVINQPNQPSTKEMDEDEDLNIDQYLNFEAIDAYPCNGPI